MYAAAFLDCNPLLSYHVAYLLIKVRGHHASNCCHHVWDELRDVVTLTAVLGKHRLVLVHQCSMSCSALVADAVKSGRQASKVHADAAVYVCTCKDWGLCAEHSYAASLKDVALCNSSSGDKAFSPFVFLFFFSYKACLLMCVCAGALCVEQGPARVDWR